MADITEELLDFSGDNIGQYMPAVQPMGVGVLMRAASEIHDLRIRLQEEMDECDAQVDIVVKFANYSDRLLVAGDLLAAAVRSGHGVDDALENWDSIREL